MYLNMRHITIILSTFFFIYNVYCTNTDVTQCANSNAILPNVLIATDRGVCETPPCSAVSGAPIYLYVNFTSPYYLENIKPHIVATVLEMDIPYPLNQNNACYGITNTNCPLVAKEPVNYYYQMNLFPGLPQISLQITFTIRDEANERDVVCFASDIVVVT